MTEEELGQIAFEAYSDFTGGKTYNGLPIPEWHDVGDTVQGAWIAAARAVRESVS